MQIKEVKNI